MLEAVLQALLARVEHHPAGVRVVGVEEAGLGGVLRAAHRDQEAVGAAAPEAHPEAPVGLVEDQLVVGLGGAEAVSPDLVAAPGVVDGAVVEVAAVGAPHPAAEHALDPVGEEVAGAEVLDLQDVALVADGVGGVGEQGAVGADRDAADGVEVVVAGQGVVVEQDLLAGQRGLVGAGVLGRGRRGPVVRVGDRDAARRAVLAALEGAPVVPPAAVARRHRQVGLLGAGLDLLEELLAQVGEVGGPRRVQAFSASRYAVTSGSSLARSQSYSSVRLRPWCSVVTGRAVGDGRSRRARLVGRGLVGRELVMVSTVFGGLRAPRAPTSIASCSSSATCRPTRSPARTAEWSSGRGPPRVPPRAFLDPRGRARAGRRRCVERSADRSDAARRGRRRRRGGLAWLSRGERRPRGERPPPRRPCAGGRAAARRWSTGPAPRAPGCWASPCTRTTRAGPSLGAQPGFELAGHQHGAAPGRRDRRPRWRSSCGR